MKKFIVYTDGGSRGNPGPAGIGVVICGENGKTLKEYGEFLGEATNNDAEYQALIFALKKIKALYGKDATEQSQIEIRSDSELMVNQLAGKYKVMEPNIQSLFIKAWNLKIDFGEIKFTLIPREENKRADRLANEAMDNQTKLQGLGI